MAPKGIVQKGVPPFCRGLGGAPHSKEVAGWAGGKDTLPRRLIKPDRKGSQPACSPTYNNVVHPNTRTRFDVPLLQREDARRR